MSEEQTTEPTAEEQKAILRAERRAKRLAEAESKPRQRTDADCQRCDQFVGYFGNATNTLLGVYHTRLCIGCLNDWELFIREHPIFVGLQDVELQANMLFWGNMGRDRDITDEARKIQARERQLKMGAFEVAEDWVAQKIVRETPES